MSTTVSTTGWVRSRGAAAALVGVAALLAPVGVALVLAQAPAGASGGDSSGPSPLSEAQLAAGAGHACIVAGHGPPRIDWAQLTNPILAYPDAGAKDEALVWAGGRWHMVFSYLTDDPRVPGGVLWNIATATSDDLAHWSAPSPWPRQPDVEGVASPDVTRSPSGRFVVTYQSDPGEPGGRQDRLYERTSSDLVHFSAPRPLAHALAPAPGDRMIDGALAWTGHGVILGYKSGVEGGSQAFEVAWSPTGSLAGPWTVVGKPDISVDDGTVENYEFVTVGGHWDLVATSNELDQPWLFSLTGDPATPSGWLRWSAGRQLLVPAAPWDTGEGISSIGFEHANSAFLCDARSVDGYDYLLYAGSSELSQFGGWGHAEIGIARSTDLVHWQVPGTGR